MINCRGELGMIEVLGCTKDFQVKVFDVKLINKIKTLLFSLGNWNPGKDGTGVPVDSQKFLTFVFQIGALKDILPK